MYKYKIFMSALPLKQGDWHLTQLINKKNKKVFLFKLKTFDIITMSTYVKTLN